MIPLIPLLWIASSNFFYLILLQIFAGLAWSGFNLCSVNYLYDATNTRNRTRYLSLFNCGNGLATGAGALLGGFLASHLPYLRGSQILVLFLISGILRGVVAMVFLPQIKEVRKVSHVPAAQLFYILMGGHSVNRRPGHRPILNFRNPIKLRKLQNHKEPDAEIKN